MVHYRLYFLNALGSHIERFKPVDAGDDAEAIRLADIHRSGDPMELWDRGRLVHRFDALRPVLMRNQESL